MGGYPGSNINNNINNNNNHYNNMNNIRQKGSGRNMGGKLDEDRPIHDNLNNIIEEQAEEIANQQMHQCPEGCGRSFIEEALEKHIKICKKVFQSKRKKFDIQKQRLEDDQKKVISYENKLAGKNELKIPTNNNNKKAKWKQQSEGLRAIMKVNRKGHQNMTATEQRAMDDA